MEHTRPIFVTYWWAKNKNEINTNTSYDHFQNKSQKPITYLQTTEQLGKDITSKGLDFFSKRIRYGDYQTNINHKPQFIKECLNKFKRPVVYMDNDLRMYKYPTKFVPKTTKASTTDFMALNWNERDHKNKHRFETAGPLFYFNNTTSSRRLLDEWIRLTELPKFKGKADDRLLAMAFVTTKASTWCRYKWFDNTYLHFPAYFDDVPKSKVVICHPYYSTSEDEAHQRGACKNRVPQGYESTIKLSRS
jgi:hypothetical protein